MIQLVYVSGAKAVFDDARLRALLKTARANNSQLGVTGVLMHQAGAFLQVLEGEATVVQKLFDKIGGDPRHQRVVMLAKTEIESASFPDWSMGFVDVKGSASALPGFRQIGDLSGLAGDTAAVERVVRSFRDGRWGVAA